MHRISPQEQSSPRANSPRKHRADRRGNQTQGLAGAGSGKRLLLKI